MLPNRLAHTAVPAFEPASGRVLGGAVFSAEGGCLGIDSREVARLFRAHGSLVYARSLRLLGSDAEADEVTQDAFVRLLTTTSNVPDGNEIVPWLYTLTTNLCLNRLRNRRRRDALHDTTLKPPAEADSPSPSALAQVRALLASADEREARAAICVLVDGMTHDEAAEHLGVSRRTVGNLVERFKVWAQARLEEEPVDSRQRGTA